MRARLERLETCDASTHRRDSTILFEGALGITCCLLLSRLLVAIGIERYACRAYGPQRSSI